MGRLEKVNQQVKRAIGTFIHQELSDPRLQFVSITQVDVSPDLRNAKVYFSMLGDSKNAKVIEGVLNKAKGLIRKQVGHACKMRYTPDLYFVYDPSIEASIRIEQALEDLNQDDEKTS